eukprot:CAMPEP_0115863524 /NCGR_PEP_ID=MMETSP0287-20121206/18732_1 /TAXON_ID=412157 /ORGANISM="Chrysochromulina rotalis, Strain UIO044" /LENGTH=76 /DNA_ID=CAMNT_0003317971 /DNA_START=148 /DNA_END=378 /DNA_ORIENTATION=+
MAEAGTVAHAWRTPTSSTIVLRSAPHLSNSIGNSITRVDSNVDGSMAPYAAAAEAPVASPRCALHLCALGSALAHP